MPDDTAAVTVLESSATSSSSVTTLSVAVDDSAANVTDSGNVPLIAAPLSVTATVTVSAAAVAPVRDSVNDAAVPSVTGVVPAAIETTGSVDDVGPGTVAAAACTSGSPSMQIASVSPHARAGSRMTISPVWFGSTVTSQPRLLRLVRRRA